MTEAEVEAIWGPPVLIGANPSRLDGKPIRMQPDEPGGWPHQRLPYEQCVLIKTEKCWWYDDDHVFWVYFDENGVVVKKSSPAINPPRSTFRRWWNRVREFFE